MGWDLASNQDVMSRLLAQGGETKGGPQQFQPNAAYAPGAPVRPVAQVTPSPVAPKQADAPLPTWQGEQGYGNVNNAQRDYLMGQAASQGGGGQPSQPFAAYNWSQQRPSVTQGIPQWADQMLNQSAYNALPKNTQGAPTYAQGFDRITRYDTEMRSPATNPNFQRHYNVPNYARGDDWYGTVDTTRPNWTSRNSARYQYLPDAEGGFGEFLMAAAPLFAGAMFPGFGLSGLGNLGTAASNAMSVSGNALRN